MPPRVLITRRSAEPLGRLLIERGLDPVHVPLIELASTGAPPPSGRPDHVLITSPAVAEFTPRLVDAIGDARVVSVGHKTTDSLVELGLDIALTGQSGGSELVDAIAPAVGTDDVVWHIGAVEVSPAIEAAFVRWGHPVVRWTVYDNRAPDDLRDRLARVLPVDVVLFTSGSTARHFAAHATLGNARVVAIGQPTARVCEDLGLPVHHVTAEPTMDALADGARLVLQGPWVSISP